MRQTRQDGSARKTPTTTHMWLCGLKLMNSFSSKTKATPFTKDSEGSWSKSWVMTSFPFKLLDTLGDDPQICCLPGHFEQVPEDTLGTCLDENRTQRYIEKNIALERQVTINTYIYIYVYVRLYVYVYLHMHMHICVCFEISVYISFFNNRNIHTYTQSLPKKKGIR